MLTHDYTLNGNEISFLDEMISKITLSNKDLITPLSLDKAKEIDLDGNSLESLRIKGILEITMKNVKTFYDFEGEERVTSVERGVVHINNEELIKYWISTIFYRAGKGEQFNKELLLKDLEEIYYPIDVGTESIKLYFVTDSEKELKEKPNSVYISFIGELNLPDDIYCLWWQPFQEFNAPHLFFDWIKDSIKKSSEKKYSFINIPTDLEAKDRERIYLLIKSVLTNKLYIRNNLPENFYPESIDYLIPETVIEDCFIKEASNEKIFLIKKNNRVEIHTFKNGEKESNEPLGKTFNTLQSYLDNKAEDYRRVTEQTKSSLPRTLLRYTPILIMFIVSLLSSLGVMLSKQNLANTIASTNTWLIINIVINAAALLFLFFITILPHLKLFFFKWDKGLKKLDL